MHLIEMSLLAASSPMNVFINICYVALGLGAVIFVHELGHFLVAKACGVKCEKFYVGFDVPIKIGPIQLPAALWRKQWGETEYGIGILPLGGYVKMLGQDDNPGRISDEIRRSQEVEGVETVEIMGPDGDKYTVDKRSYLAKSVPQRMAIISAGVIMNIIFAFIFAVWAYGIGVPYSPSIVSSTLAGAPAWQAGVRTGDEFLQIGDKTKPSYEDLINSVTLGDLESGLSMRIAHPSREGDETITLKPRRKKSGGLAQIGVTSPASLVFDEPTASQFSVAAQAKLADPQQVADEDQAKLLPGDKIVAIEGVDVTHYYQVIEELAKNVENSVTLTVERAGAKGTTPQRLDFVVPPRPMKRFGLVMKLGKIVAIQQESPAEEAGLQPGDFLEAVNSQLVGDPVLLPHELRRRAQQGDSERWVSLTVKRMPQEGQYESVVLENVETRVATWIETSASADAPLAVSALGMAYHVLNRVDRVIPGSPADKVGLKPGDEIVGAELIEDDIPKELRWDALEFGEEAHNWPFLMEVIQSLPETAKVRLTVKREGKTLNPELSPAVLTPEDGTVQAYLIRRGFYLKPLQRIRQAENFQEQMEMGLNKTGESLLLVYRFLRKLVSSQIPATAVGGPITIAKASFATADQGLGKFLAFLTILSANLAVINFLPIPLLDGGHMVFLAYEGIRRRPPNERIVVAMHTIGLVLILGMMLFVIILDVGLIKRNI